MRMSDWSSDVCSSDLPQAWVGVSLEILKRVNQRSFEMASAVQHTPGQGFMMAFQAGGSHAKDRGLEAVAYAWQAMARIPGLVSWEKPQCIMSVPLLGGLDGDLGCTSCREKRCQFVWS